VQDVRYERHYLLDGHTVRFAANTDGVVQDRGGPLRQYDRFMHGEHTPKQIVEAKTARSVDHWGMPGTDAIPDTYLVQVYCQMWCSGAEFAWVPVQCGFDFYVYEVGRPPEDQLEEMIRTCAEWWVKYVIPKVKPEGPPASVEVLSTIEREGGSAIELPAKYATMADEWEGAKAAARAASLRAAKLKDELIEALDKCEIGMLPNGHLSYHANRNGVRTLKWNKDR